MKLSLGEQETVLRWDRETGVVTLWTCAPHEARKWKRAGYNVAQDGVGWRAEGPKDCVRVRKVRDGVLARRAGRVPNNLPKKDVPF